MAGLTVDRERRGRGRFADRVGRSRRRARLRHAAPGAGALDAACRWRGSASGGTVADLVARRARRATRAGFFYVAVCDHVAIPREPAEAMSTTWYDPVATLGVPRGAHHAHAADDQRVRRVVPPSAPDREGVRDARRAVGRTRDPRRRRRSPRGRVRRARRAVRASAARSPTRRSTASSTRGPTSGPPHDGARWRYADVGQGPRPVQQPHPPIWIGGSGKPALRRVARVGDGWIPQGTPPERLADDIAFILRDRDTVRPGAVPDFGYHAYVLRRRPDVGLAEVHGDGHRPHRRLAQRDRRDGRLTTCRCASRRDRPTRSATRSPRFGAEIGPHLTRVALS